MFLSRLLTTVDLTSTTLLLDWVKGYFAYHWNLLSSSRRLWKSFSLRGNPTALSKARRCCKHHDDACFLILSKCFLKLSLFSEQKWSLFKLSFLSLCFWSSSAEVRLIPAAAKLSRPFLISFYYETTTTTAKLDCEKSLPTIFITASWIITLQWILKTLLLLHLQ